MNRALFCWEMGDLSGHVIPYLSLIEALRRRGWEVAVAVRNTAEVGARVQASGATLFQAPVSLSVFPELDGISFNSTEILLQHGYGHEPTFDGMFSSWLALMRTWKPDLVIGSFAPTAHLAAQCLSIPDVAIGVGFTCPAVANPAPLIRPWQPGVERRIASSEDRVRQVINAVLPKHGFARRQFPMDMYSDVPALLCTLPELDHFGVHRGAGTDYLGRLPSAVSSHTAKRIAPPLGFEVFVYVRYTTAIDGLLRALAKRSPPALIYLPRVTPAQRAKLEAEYGASLAFVTEAVDMSQILPNLKLIISNAGHGLMVQCLLAGKPLMLLPLSMEQDIAANLAVNLGVAVAISANEQRPKFQRRIDDIVQKPNYRDAAESFAKRYQHLSEIDALEKAIQTCERRADVEFKRNKLMSVG